MHRHHLTLSSLILTWQAAWWSFWELHSHFFLSLRYVRYAIIHILSYRFYFSSLCMAGAETFRTSLTTVFSATKLWVTSETLLKLCNGNLKHDNHQWRLITHGLLLSKNQFPNFLHKNTLINPLEHSVVSDATGLAKSVQYVVICERLRHQCRLLVILAFCQ